MTINLFSDVTLINYDLLNNSYLLCAVPFVTYTSKLKVNSYYQ